MKDRIKIMEHSEKTRWEHSVCPRPPRVSGGNILNQLLGCGLQQPSRGVATCANQTASGNYLSEGTYSVWATYQADPSYMISDSNTVIWIVGP